MNEATKALVISLALHAAVAGGGMTLISAMPQVSEALVIDLNMQDSRCPFDSTPSAAPNVPNQQQRCQFPRQQQAVTPAATPKAEPAVLAATQASPSPVAAEEIRQVAAPASSASVQLQSAVSPANAAQSGSSGNSGGSTESMSSEQLQQIYTKEHFAYIKRIVAEKIRYPRAARLRQQEGTVLISFTIGRDGSISALQIVSGSGHELLDGHAMAAVREAAPFPRPPVMAQIRIPIVYSLTQR